MEATVAAGANPLAIELTRAVGVGDAGQLEVQRALGASYKEIEALRASAAQISSDGVDVKA